ncbi:hypothetical protein SAMN05518801_105150 [Novosphingobium sp. CF614]|uniref:SMP-30/gluconolactonase/LRE family protein n=1 Tax=Novosphingobium sp. CF614 TaxID=1884364 RepID=UPI0008E20E84|nr:SMP-30/gluconolactonase/LRE family protein [Novosphingobium sp. CF614]SFG00793.1 hypothetical protein SAMN05518801_105150 [Novosphingobium sp. CF614]
MAQFEVRHMLDIKADLGEAPLWSVEQGTLYWLDIYRRLLLGPTMTSFGGKDMSTLFITSCRLETVMGPLRRSG